MRAAFHNLGCKVNEYETEAMKQQLSDEGYEIVSFDDVADVYVVNTCTVTSMADRKSRQMLHKARQNNAQAVIVAAGCYVQEGGRKLLEDGSVDIILGNNEKKQLAAYLVAYQKGQRFTPESIPNINKERSYENLELERPVDRTRAFVKIQDGCNQFCAYCLIPYVRGRVRSRHQEDIMAEIKRLADNGVKEVVLTGIHLSSYGLDFNEGASLTDMRTPDVSRAVTNFRLLALIEKIQDTAGIARIRLGSLEPGIVTEEFAAGIAKCDKICPQFHLSLQSGCNRTLERMNRRYRAADFKLGVDRLRRYFDRPALTTDVIVGFPGETEDEFEETVAFLKTIRFAKTHIFKYSRREKTKAYSMPHQVTEAVKSARSHCLLALDKKNQEAYCRELCDKKLEILFEEKRTINGITYWKGHTKENLTALLASEENLENEILTCRYLGSSEDGAVLVVRDEA